jgi:hypothetical protein
MKENYTQNHCQPFRGHNGNRAMNKQTDRQTNASMTDSSFNRPNGANKNKQTSSGITTIPSLYNHTKKTFALP